MRILTTRKIFLSLLVLVVLTSKMNAQDQNTTVSQDPKFEQLLNEKRKINASLTVNDSYKIQIYNGGSDNA